MPPQNDRARTHPPFPPEAPTCPLDPILESSILGRSILWVYKESRIDKGGYQTLHRAVSTSPLSKYEVMSEITRSIWAVVLIATVACTFANRGPFRAFFIYSKKSHHITPSNPCPGQLFIHLASQGPVPPTHLNCTTNTSYSDIQNVMYNKRVYLYNYS
ncbi:uncharacterized protein ARMOST_21417 [Armillaria ostoyae]|uniref:Uncharacterized protein n=1 Tax=Armillaria ostoyae TaxID=47428 RepID=A0A284SA14_ARMOS|nr:uncharacterized protein ARMOST_21417 [Armillaria ostoyae]